LIPDGLPTKHRNQSFLQKAFGFFVVLNLKQASIDANKKTKRCSLGFLFAERGVFEPSIF
tara:strand:+ start:65 stop:244 length:180 start_codon:yes stop_codon:yes gene_type:complete